MKANTYMPYTLVQFSDYKQARQFTLMNEERKYVLEIRVRSIRILKPNYSVVVGQISGQMLRLGEKVMITLLTLLFEISINNSDVPDNWREAIVVPIFKSGSGSETGNYRPLSLTSVVCK